MKSVNLFGFSIAKINLSETVRKIEELVEKGTAGQLMTINPEYVVRADEDEQLKKAIANSSLIVADGAGIILASWLQKKEKLSFKERVRGGELVERLAALVAQKGWKIGLIGGEPGVAKKALQKLVSRHPEPPLGGEGSRTREGKMSLSFAGGDSSSFDKLRTQNDKGKSFAEAGSLVVEKETAEDHQRIIDLIVRGKPQILLTSFGFYGPVWIEKILKELKSRGVTLVAIEVGGVFNYLAGRSKRAPQILSQMGLEWLWRLVNEPWRIKRQLRLWKFVKMTIKAS